MYRYVTALLAIFLVSPAAPASARPEPETADRAPVTEAATDAPLEVWFTPGSASVNGIAHTLSVSGGYACKDNLGTANVEIELTFLQDNGARKHTELIKPCQTLNGTWSVSGLGSEQLLPAFQQGIQMAASAVIHKKGAARVESENNALLIKDPFFVRLDAAPTISGDGTASAGGTIWCAATYGVIHLDVSLEEVNGDHSTEAGVGIVDITCNGTNQSFSVPVTPTISTTATGVSSRSVGCQNGNFNGNANTEYNAGYSGNFNGNNNVGSLNGNMNGNSNGNWY